MRIGKALAAGTETDDQLDQLDRLLARCDQVKRRAVTLLAEALVMVELGSGAVLSVRGRTKTLATLREKLVRMGGHQLPRVRDLVGVRIVGDMTLAEQDAVLGVAAHALGTAADDVKIIDRRAEPMRGYRALHGEITLDGVLVEIQVRTTLQHEWAEVYERAGDRFGRAIRYPVEIGPATGTVEGFTRTMDEMASTIALVEVEGGHLGERFVERRRELTLRREIVEAVSEGPWRAQQLQEERRLAEEVAAMELSFDQLRYRLRVLLGTLGGRLDGLVTEEGT